MIDAVADSPFFRRAKSIVTTVLPDSILQQVKNRYYRWAVPRVSPRDEPALGILSRFVALGDEVVDIGANVGVYTTKLSAIVGSHGRVFAFEPIPETFCVLESVNRSFQHRNTTLIQRAVSDREERVEMEIPHYSGERRENFYRARMSYSSERGAIRRCTVNTVTADNALLPLTRRVSFVKIDVEGAELRVIQGATHLLRRDRPVCLIEVGSDPEQSGSDGALLFGVMAALGYAPYFLQDGALYPRKTGDKQTDYLFLPAV